MAPIRFVHAADLHLDNPFVGLHARNPPERVAKTLRDATFSAYDNIINLCIDEGVEALLVAGDVYDGADRSLRAQLEFFKGLERLDAHGIRSFVCHGNHDPLDGWQARLTAPAGCHQFGARVEAVPFDPSQPERGTVVGVSYPKRDVTENLAVRFGAAAKQGFAIGLLHCNVGTDTGHLPYAPCSIEDLVGIGIDYWALGHVHTRQVLRPQSPAIVYPGNTQGRHVNEQGARGVYVADVGEDGAVALTFHESGPVRWETAVVSVAGMQTEQQLLDAIDRAVGKLLEAAGGRDLVYRLRIEGRGELHDSVRRNGFTGGIEERLNAEWGEASQFAWCERIEAATSADFNRAALRDAPDFTGDLLRLIDSVRTDPRQLERLASQLHALYGHARAGRYLKAEALAEAELGAVLDEVETACLEALA